MNGRLDPHRDSSGFSRRSHVCLPALETIMTLVVFALSMSAVFPGITNAQPLETTTIVVESDAQPWIPPSFDIEIEPLAPPITERSDTSPAHR
jgi:hypothetical protein